MPLVSKQLSLSLFLCKQHYERDSSAFVEWARRKGRKCNGQYSILNVFRNSGSTTNSHFLLPLQIAFDGEPVLAADGTQLAAKYHPNCDGGAAIAKTGGSGGYYYVSNSEIGEYPAGFAGDRMAATTLIGGAYSLEFTADHKLIGYKQVLANTGKNCHGGETPWNTWVSCEEHREFGVCWQGELFSSENDCYTSEYYK